MHARPVTIAAEHSSSARIRGRALPRDSIGANDRQKQEEALDPRSAVVETLEIRSRHSPIAVDLAGPGAQPAARLVEWSRGNASRRGAVAFDDSELPTICKETKQGNSNSSQ